MLAMTAGFQSFDSFDMYSYFYDLVRQIPQGMVTAYGDLARALGDVAAARACGHMLSINPDPVGTPCYRVVHSSGEVGKYTHPLGQNEKVRKLENDGIEIENGSVKDFTRLRFNSFKTDYPLNKMREEQLHMASQVMLEDDFDASLIGAVDVSYDDFYGYGAFVYYEDGDLHVKSAVMPVNFPYIPGYLAYREFRFIKSLCGSFEGTLLLDGNGYLHPRRIGMASYSGVRLDIPTIGVAKSLLMGNVENGFITADGEKVGYMLNRHTIVSPGHRISLDSAIAVVKSLDGGKYPGILKAAHNETVRLRTIKRNAERPELHNLKSLTPSSYT